MKFLGNGQYAKLPRTIRKLVVLAAFFMTWESRGKIMDGFQID